MKTPILLLLLIVSGFSCKKSTDNAVVIDINVDIQLVDDQDKNLIDQVPSVDFNDLKIYYVVNGKKDLFYNGNYGYPKGYGILESLNGDKYLRLFPNTKGEMPVTLIQFNETDIDTVKCEFYKKESNIICTKVWYNNVLKWDVADKNSSETREITIVKDL